MIERTLQINAPCDVVFEVIRSFELYPEFLSSTKSAKVRRLKSGLFVDFQVSVIKTIEYTLKIEEIDSKSLRWVLHKGDLFKKNSGAWELEEIAPDKTEARYSIDVGFGWMVPSGLVHQLTETQLPELLDSFKKRAETLWNQRKAVS